jgi:hypothetical protein
MIIVLLFTVCQCSIRNIRKFISYALDTSISNGNVVSTLDSATRMAKAVNDSYDLSSCKNSSTDELYHRSKPVLASVDLDSKFCMSLSPETTRDGIVWGCHLLDMMTKGYAPDRNVMDGGTGMKWAFKEVLPHVIIGRDHWHVIDESNNINRYLRNKKETAITNAIKDSNNIDTDDLSTKAMIEAEYISETFNTLIKWLQYDVLQFQGAPYEDRSILFDFIVESLQELSKRHPHRIKAFATTLINQKELLLNASVELDASFAKIGEQHNLSTSIIWDICNLAKYSRNSSNYYIKSLGLYDQIGESYDIIEDEVLLAISKVHRTSSLIENLNSRLRPFLDARKGFKKERYPLIEFALNHLPFERSEKESHKGKSAAEIFSKRDNIGFIELLGFQRFRKAA